MKMKKIFICICSVIVVVSCKEKMSEQEIYSIGKTPCRKPAAFIKQIGFDPNTSAFSTTEKRVKGLVLVQFPKTVADSNSYKIYQDSSWKQFGFMGSITTDDKGNVYTAPIPMVNTLETPIAEMNKVYKVDANTGKMQLFYELPKPIVTAGTVPFAVMGNFFDCHSKKLYVSSVAGSTREKESGSIYVIDLTTNKVIDELKNIDAMGLFVGGTTGKKLLYFGNARASTIQCVELDKEGKFETKKPETILSLDGLGPRGNDRARKIRCDKYGNLIVHGLDFAFNLAAQSDRPETVYQFNYSDDEKKWTFYSILH